MRWTTSFIAICVTLAWIGGCGNDKGRRIGLVGRWQVVEQQRETACRFMPRELQLYPNGKAVMSNIPQSDLIYITEIEPDHFERLKRKHPNIEQGNTIVVVLRQRPKGEAMMGMAYRYLLKENDALILEYRGCRPTTYRRAIDDLPE